MKIIICVCLQLIIVNGDIDPEYRTKTYVPLTPKMSVLTESQGTSPFIIEGNETVPHSRPFQAALYINGLYFCGGILISDSWVVTSAHCAFGASSIIVQLGAHNRTSEEPTQVSIESSHIIWHELYNVIELFNDIALLELSAPVQFTDEIQPIILPGKNDPEIEAGQNVTLSGWGLTTDDPQEFISDILNEVTVPLISNADCVSIYGDVPIQESKICTDGSGGHGPCNGDTGPLTYDSPDGIQAIGILSFGASNGCSSGYPAVFTKVSYYLDWIQTNTGGI